MSLVCLNPPVNFQLYLTTIHKGQAWPTEALFSFSWKHLICSRLQTAYAPSWHCVQCSAPRSSSDWLCLVIGDSAPDPNDPVHTGPPLPFSFTSFCFIFFRNLSLSESHFSIYMVFLFVYHLKLAKLQGLGQSPPAKSVPDFWHQM